MGGFKVTGLDELSNYLKSLEKKAHKLNGTHSVPFSELFDGKFMRKYTSFSSISEMFDKSGFKVETEEDFKNIPDAEWDVYVKANTKFKNWEEMIQEAGTRYAAKQLGF